jgi:hypothetical protein
VHVSISLPYCRDSQFWPVGCQLRHRWRRWRKITGNSLSLWIHYCKWEGLLAVVFREREPNSALATSKSDQLFLDNFTLVR